MLDSLTVAFAILATPAPSSVGLQPFTVLTTAPAETLQAVLWYPTRAPSRDTVLGLRPVQVARGAPLLPGGRLPLILISHGTGGNEFGHLDAALALARAGYIVATIRHPGDNAVDDSGLGTDRQVYGRSHQVARLLDALLADAAWGARLDSMRVGLLGFSAGGYTGMTLLGARPDFTRLGAFCERYPTDEMYCAGGLGGNIRLTGSYSGPRADPRIRAAVLYAPAFGFLLDSSSVAAIRRPVHLVRAGRDEIVREPDNVERVARLLTPSRTPEVIAGAGHYIFLAPCSPALGARAPGICLDPPGVDRITVHRQLDEELITFFGAQLGRKR